MVKFTEREAGTYRARFVSLDTDFEITDKATKEIVKRWRWVFQAVDDDTTVGQIDTITSPGFNKGSNGLRFLTGMLGRPPTNEDDTDNLIGQVFDVQYGPNRAGNLAIVGVLKVANPNAGAALPPSDPTLLGAKVKDRTSDGNLPF